MDMEQDENDAAIVRSTIDLAHNLGLKVTAEGVEKEGALQLLDVLGCDSAQGFHICRPVSAEDLVSWVPQWRAMNRARLLLEDEDTLDQSAMGQTFR
jgi:EAL domain-containing protein (putative c-di-GMP-specific phosphodiesterase class I)